MKLPNGYGSVVKLSGKRRNPYLVRKTNGWHFDKEKDKQIQDFIIIGYAPTRADGLQMLADYNKNPFCFLASNFPHFHRYDSLKSALYIHAVSKNINTFPKNQGRIRAAIAVEILDFTVMYR